MIFLQSAFDALFWIVMFVLGMDFFMSASLLFKKGPQALAGPVLLGLLFIKANQNIYKKMQKQYSPNFFNRLLELAYSYEYTRYYFLIGGLIIMIFSVLGFITFVLLS